MFDCVAVRQHLLECRRTPTSEVASRITTVADLGQFVRSRRKELGWSQQELARAAGVSRSWIVEFESGKARAELALVLRTVDALGLTVDVADRQRQGRLPADTADMTGAVDLDEVLSQYSGAQRNNAA